jgi:predicted transposase YbfD/YdcC
MQRFVETCEGVVALDGKTLRRSFDRASAASPLHLVSAWAADQRLVLGQLAVGDKSNEIVAVPKLLELLSLRGTIVTADALNCQRQIARQVTDQGGDYALALKGNQPVLFDDVRRFLDDPETPLVSAGATDAGHGRIETRTASLTSDIAWLQESHAWPGLQAIGKVEATREIDGGPAPDPLLPAGPSADRPVNAIVRSHWGIENGLHWVLDVIMDEDDARNRKDHGPENLALLRRLALNLAKLEPSKGSMRGKLKRAGWDTTFLADLLANATRLQVR